ncbi:MAG TPA: bifunctional metallophosphatase/5'-nucleotidase [Usitatibacter sp.]|nr:bifunctional metallophosphatase/5'-nucleotidase [Usitatibacter sp.]
MTRHLLRLFLACMLAATPLAAHSREPVQVRFIGINDFHGHLESGNLTLFLADPGGAPGSREIPIPTGGGAALAGLVKKLREGSRHNLMVAGGDLIGAAPLVSSLFRHESTVEFLNSIKLDVSTLGNHEFDAGVAELRRLMRGGCAGASPDGTFSSCTQGRYAGTRFKYIAANVVDARNRPLVAPYVIRYFEGIPVGLIGGVTRTTPQMVTPSGIRGFTFLDEASAANQAAAQLRARGVKAMVAIFHEGIELGTVQKRGDWNDTSCPDAHGPLLDIARRLDPAINLVFSGHTHQGYRCEIDGRLLIQGTSYGRGVSVVDVELDRRTGTLKPVRSINLPVLNDRTTDAQREKLAAATPQPFAAVLREARPDAAVAERVAVYSALVKPRAERRVGTISGRFDRESASDSSAGRLVADAQLAATRALGSRVAFMNPGGIRANLECRAPPCDVTFGTVFTMQPFSNSLIVMTLTGEQLKALLEEQLKRASGEPKFLIPSEGFTYTWQDDAPLGDHVRDMRLDGEPIEPARRYRVTVNSFLAEGGDGFELLKDGTEREGGGPDIDAVIAYLGAAERAPVTVPRATRTGKEKAR